MRDTRMLQAILDSLVVVRNDLKRLENKVDDGFKKVNERLDKQGKALAYLEDDAPTREEYEKLEKRVTKIEHKVASA